MTLHEIGAVILGKPAEIFIFLAFFRTYLLERKAEQALVSIIFDIDRQESDTVTV